MNDIYPIIENFDDEGIINKKNYIQNINKEDLNIDLIKNKNIDSVLFIFDNEFPEFLNNHTKEFYVFKNGSNINKVYLYEDKFLLAFSPLGGPAAGGLMEELGFLGMKNFFACGSAGQIDHSIDSKKFVLVDMAIRDEGTSYHYLKPSIYVESDNELTNALASFLDKSDFDYIKSTTWTTDAFFRETPKAVNQRIKQGAVCVEMECASWCAIAKFRKYKFAQLLYFSDAVKQEAWQWNIDKKELKNNIIKLMINFMLNFTKQSAF